MSKKRVYELAKDLGMSNKELVDWLVAHDYDEIKSHSSSLEEGQAQAVTEKVLAERKPKAPAPPPTTPGFVVRRKVVGAPAPAVASPPAAGTAVPAGETRSPASAASDAASQHAAGTQEAPVAFQRRGRPQSFSVISARNNPV